MKHKLLFSLLAVGLLAVTGHSQPISVNTNTTPATLEGPIWDAFSLLGTATNWAVAPFLTIAEKDGGGNVYGGGIAGIYNITEQLGSMLRADFLDDNWNMVSGGLEFQWPIKLGDWGVIRPFGESLVAIPFGQNVNDKVLGILGAGADIKFPKLSRHWSMAFSAEFWTDRDGIQWRIAPFVWKF
jgi:hypothetical protein